jgi:hypothetical protein
LIDPNWKYRPNTQALRREAMAQDGYRKLPLTFKVVFKASDCQVRTVDMLRGMSALPTCSESKSDPFHPCAP